MHQSSIRFVAGMAASLSMLFAPTVLAENGALELEPVTVTGTITEREARELLTSITVIDRESFERQQPRDVTDLMRGRPGVDVSNNGPYGKVSSVFTRGIGGEGSLLLVDGVRLGSVTAGGASWQYLPPQLIESMEIVRGPRASLYGSDAVGGVVQVFTPKGEGEPEPWAQAGAGSFGSHEFGSGVSGKRDRTSYNVGFNHFHTDGIRLREDADERQGYYNTSAVARVSQGIGEASEVGFSGLQSEGRTEFLGGRSNFRHQAIGGYYETEVSELWETRIGYSESRDHDHTNNDDGTESRADSTRQMIDWRNTLDLDAHELILGADYRDAQVDGTTDYEEDSRDNTGLFVQSFFDFDPFDFEASLRYDDNEAYGSETTGALAAAWDLDGVHRLRASHGTAFRAPTFNDLYFPGFSNPDLEPEHSASTELGVTGRHGDWYWDAVAYQTDADNLIQFVVDDQGVGQPQNVAEARIRGLELSGGAMIGDWDLYAAATWTDPVDRETGNQLRRRATESLRFEVDRELGDWSLGATTLIQGGRYEDEANEDRISGYGLLNLRVGYQLASNWKIRATAENVLDEEYTLARGQDMETFEQFDFQQPGRNFYLTLRYGGF